MPEVLISRPAVRALVRPVLFTAGLCTAYFVLPMRVSFTLVTVSALVAGFALFCAIIIWETRAIMRSPYPRLRGIQALATSIPLFLILFATAYYLMDNSDPDTFAQSLTRTDALYFTVTVFSTVGFGDIVPYSQAARIVAMVQMLMDLIVIGLVARVLFDAVRRGLDRRGRADDQDSSPR